MRKRVLRLFERCGPLASEVACAWRHGGGFSLDATVLMEARDRTGLESQGQGVALLAAPRMQRLAWTSKGELVVYALPKPGTLGEAALSLAP